MLSKVHLKSIALTARPWWYLDQAYMVARNSKPRHKKKYETLGLFLKLNFDILRHAEIADCFRIT